MHRFLMPPLLALAATAAAAQTPIDQNRALAGNISPGDTPGFPITLNQPGSYKLTSNLYVPAGLSGVDINAANVTLDLNGFAIVGPEDCRLLNGSFVCNGTAGSAAGVLPGENSRVMNGSIRGFAHGLQTNVGFTAERLTLSLNREWGVRIINANGANAAHLAELLVERNGKGGLLLTTRASLRDSVISQNGGVGIELGHAIVHVRGNQLFDNRGYAINAGGGTAYVQATVQYNNSAATLGSVISLGNNVGF
jgi:hypothetical protein